MAFGEKPLQVIPTENPVGLWYRLSPEEGETDGAEVFTEEVFRLIRRSYERKGIDDVEGRLEMAGRQAMAVRTSLIINRLTFPKVWPSTHIIRFTETGSDLSGVQGNLAQSNRDTLRIRRTISHVKSLITVDTHAAIDADELLLVMSPDTAKGIAASDEIAAIKESGDCEFPEENCGLPKQLYTLTPVIESSLKVIFARPGDRGQISLSDQFAVPFGTVIVCYRPKEAEGVVGGRSYSTCSIHVLKQDDLSIDVEDEFVAVNDCCDVSMTCPASGCLLLDVC